MTQVNKNAGIIRTAGAMTSSNRANAVAEPCKALIANCDQQTNDLATYLITTEGFEQVRKLTVQAEFARRPYDEDSRRHYTSLVALRNAIQNYRVWKMESSNTLYSEAARETYASRLPSLLPYIQQQAEACGLSLDVDVDPDNLPLEDTDEPQPEEADSKEAVDRARQACMAAVNKMKLSDDSFQMRAAYTSYFNEYAGTTRKTWTVRMWTQMRGAVLGGVWEMEGRCWKKVSMYNGRRLMPVAAQKERTP